MDLRVGRGDVEGTPWSVLSDLAITIVLVLVVYIVLQFIQTFRERAISAELVRRQAAVRSAILSALGARWHVGVDSLAPDRQRLTFSSEVLFQTCREVLKPEGEELLRSVGRVLGTEAAYLEAVQVEGHTDRRPIRTQGAECPFRSNWELSSARATRVVALFSAESLIANPKLSAIGRAEYHPIDRQALDTNRRIELILQYDRARVARCLAGFAPTSLSSTTPDSAKALEMEDVRCLYEEVEARIRGGGYQDGTKNYVCGTLLATGYTDVRGTIRKVKLTSRGRPQSGASHYYDSEGHLRFSFWWAMAEGDARRETRVYLDSGGRILHHSGATGATEVPDEELASLLADPERLLRSCEAGRP